MCWRQIHNARKKSQIQQILRRLPERSVILAEDETDLLQFPPLHAMWSPRGVPARVMLSGGNARRVVFGCLNLKTGHRLFRACRRQRAEEFQAFLWQVHHHYGGRHIVMLLDSDTSHTARSSQTLAKRLGIELIWLPKRAPELNPVEALWGQAKKAVSANWQYQSIDEHVDAFLAYVRGLCNATARKTAGLLSKRCWLRRATSKHLSSGA
ncbi:transposase [Noviherbaspirillum sp. CPCC 100848]|uniref:Transposase n=1 Tax=Noviherbaspirillum album TaxID=3080276 RepID=A0ABU6JGJ2_9BURK|nr:transposase [Noviherbaspirillum sp. CPCC 100848]MEC4722786.1 transposase [Noviherbaspirillum sp. CPCC 100848]